ncbi:phosphoglycerate mutase-like protein [Infundibulicybe gibba]|nr:phosphoglycerate mutase-like protein [Infundibulicybe gibba]
MPFPAPLTFALFISIATTTIGQGFDPLQHSGAASPYFDAPSQSGVPIATPAGCVVDQAAFIVRHGSRYPEPGSFTGWQALFSKIQNATFTARGPLTFLPSWTPPVDDLPHEPLFLSSTGADESFSLGVKLRELYGFTKGGENLTVWSAGQQRVVDTSTFFLRGYLSQGNYLTTPSSNRGTIIALPDSVNNTSANSLTPSAACPAYATGDKGSATSNNFRATYQQKIADRLNKFLDGLKLVPTDIGVMQDLCGFSAEVSGDTRFCDVFESSEWLDYEYAHDLNYYYGSGPGNPFSATFLSMITISTVISALGLWNASQFSPLSLTKPNPNRQFRSSYLVAFRGYVALERLSCQTCCNVLGQSDAKTTQEVFVRADNAPIPIPGCASGPGSTCPLKSFVSYVNTTRQRAAGDFVQRCGLVGVEGVTSVASFLTTTPDDAVTQIVGL